LRVAVRMKEAVAAIAIPHARSGVADRVTLSIGVATLEQFDQKRPEHLILQADQALYRAKHHGRDRIMT
jgi:diguanylate cyclase (GGDEF)-like protein